MRYLRGAELRAQPLKSQRGGFVAREQTHRRRHAGGLQPYGTEARLQPSVIQAGCVYASTAVAEAWAGRPCLLRPYLLWLYFYLELSEL